MASPRQARSLDTARQPQELSHDRDKSKAYPPVFNGLQKLVLRRRRCQSHLVPPSIDEHRPPRNSLILRKFRSFEDDSMALMQRADRSSSNGSQTSSPSQTSAKPRLLKRLASGLVPRPSMDTLANAIVTRPPRTPDASQFCGSDAFKNTEYTELPGDSFSNSLSSIIHSFPTPPKQRTTDFEEDSEATARDERSLDPLEEMGTTGLALFMVHESRLTSTSNGTSVWIAIEMRNTTRLEKAPVQHNKCGIDAVLIFDNSIYSSPATMKANSDAALTIISLLEQFDRVALVCTHPHTQTQPKHAFETLKRADDTMTRDTVCLIEGSSEVPYSSYLHDAVFTAQEILRNAPEDIDRASTCRVMGHIFLLTPNAPAYFQDSLNDPLIQCHVICPAIMPWGYANESKHNGWSIYQACSELDAVRRQGAQHNGLTDTLCQLTTEIHTGRASKPLADIQLLLEPGPNCTLEGAIDAKRITMLRPGECRTTFVRVKVHSTNGQPTTVSLSPRGMVTSSSVTDLGKEFDAILGPHSTILTARPKYTHPGLPEGTVCEINRKAEVTLAPSKYIEESPLFPSDMLPCNEGRVAVQKRWLLRLATTRDPRKALHDINIDFKCPNYTTDFTEMLQAVTDELRYRARLLNKFEADNDDVFSD